MQSRTVLMSAAAVVVLSVALVGCASQRGADGYAASFERTPVALGAGDAVGDRIRTNHIMVTGRDAWDRDRVVADEAVRIAEAMRTRQRVEDHAASAIAIEAVPVD